MNPINPVLPEPEGIWIVLLKYVIPTTIFCLWWGIASFNMVYIQRNNKDKFHATIGIIFAPAIFLMEGIIDACSNDKQTWNGSE